MARFIYKILTQTELDAAQADGVFSGSPDDRRDGYIHLSASDQLEGTLAKHFAVKSGLVLLTVDAETLGAALRWEPSRNGALFPHLYAPLPMAAVLSIEPLPVGDDGRHRMPDGIAP